MILASLILFALGFLCLLAVFQKDFRQWLMSKRMDSMKTEFDENFRLIFLFLGGLIFIGFGFFVLYQGITGNYNYK